MRTLRSCSLALAVVAVACSQGAPQLDPPDAAPPAALVARAPVQHVSVEAIARIMPSIAMRAPLARVDDGYVLEHPPVAVAGGLRAVRLGATFPARSTHALHLQLEGVRADVVALDVADAPAVLDGGVLRATDVAPSTDLVWVGKVGGAEELRVLADANAPTAFRWRIDAQAPIEGVRAREGRIELVDGAGVVRLSTDPLVATDAHGVVRALSVYARGSEIAATLDTAGLAYPIVVDPSWVSFPSMPAAMASHIAVPFAGGVAVFPTPTSAGAVYSLATNGWSVIPAKLSSPSLVAIVPSSTGGLLAGSLGQPSPVTLAPIFHLDPGPSPAWVADPTVTAIGISAGGDTNAYVVELPDHRILVQGQQNTGFVYDPVSTTMSFAGDTRSRNSLPGPSYTFIHPLTGKVIGASRLCSGGAFGGLALEIFSPPSYSPTQTGTPPSPPCSGYDLTMLGDGRILAAGGVAGTFGRAAAWLFDVNTGAWSAAADMSNLQSGLALVALPGGKFVVAIGGVALFNGTSTASLSSTEVYDVAANTWTPGPALQLGRTDARAVVVGTNILVTGGTTAPSTPTSTAEILSLAGAGTACTGSTCTVGLTCVDGVCCTTSSCPAGSSCNAASSAGTCSKVNGTACSASTDCGSGFCTGGVCCESACATGTCNAAGKAGTCLKTNGTTASSATECASGNVSDGLCCDVACTAQCQACDVAGHAGTCTTVFGQPHGGRTVCDKSSTDVCQSLSCDGKTTTSCTGLAGADVVCVPASCTGSVLTTAGVCDGTGACKPGGPTQCSPYVCAANTCKSSCADNTDCAPGLVCNGGICGERQNKCSDDGLSTIQKDGTTLSCNEYLCNVNTGLCIQNCGSTVDCSAGNECRADCTCAAISTAPTSSSSGCSYGDRDTAPWRGIPGALLGLGLCALTRRRLRPRR